jgi:hypothetical protein
VGLGGGKRNKNSNFIDVRRDGIMCIVENNCPVCGYKPVGVYTDSNDPDDFDNPYDVHSCPVCGPFMIRGLEIPRHILASYLFYHREEILSTDLAFFFIGTQDEFEIIKNKYPRTELLTYKKANTWYEQVRNKRADEILRALSIYDSDKDGYIELRDEEINSAFFLDIYNVYDPVPPSSHERYNRKIERNAQIDGVFNQLLGGFVKRYDRNSNKIKILPKGRDRIEELRRGASGVGGYMAC